MRQAPEQGGLESLSLSVCPSLSRSPDEIRETPIPRVLDSAEPVLSAVEGLHPGYFADLTPDPRL